jgi:hypothetical protein
MNVEPLHVYIIGQWSYTPAVKEPIYVVSSANKIELFGAMTILDMKKETFAPLSGLITLLAATLGVAYTSAPTAAQTTAGTTSPRERLLLDFNWRFKLGEPEDLDKSQFEYPEFGNLKKHRPNDEEVETQNAALRVDAAKVNLGSKVSWVQPNFDAASWRQLDLPHDWIVELPFDRAKRGDKDYGYKPASSTIGNTIGWYRRTFNLPAADKGRATVRAQGLKYGVSNHRLFGYDFMVPARGLKTDLYDPAYADFYGPLPKEKALASQEFLNGWLARTIELIDKYQPDFLWFDWDGTGAENPAKLQFAAYYFNRARQWGKEVAFSQKGNTFPERTGISSHEKGGRMPKEITSNVWMVDDVISDRSWSYVTDMKYRSTGSIINELIEAVSRNGTMMLNISPRSDGVIPQEQQDILLTIGKWLETNGEAIYCTRPWKQFSDGRAVRYTAKGDDLYAICLRWPKNNLTLPALSTEKVGAVKSVSMLGVPGELTFAQKPGGLEITFPQDKPSEYAVALKISGANLR